MKILRLWIKNYKSIDEMVIDDIDNTLILVGKNNTGKSAIMSAILLFSPSRPAMISDFGKPGKSIEIGMRLQLTDEDLSELHKHGKVSKYRKYDQWLQEFKKRIPSYRDGYADVYLKITVDLVKKYSDGIQKVNNWICDIIPSFHVVDERRDLTEINKQFIDLQGMKMIEEVKENKCIFDPLKKCYECFMCIPLINKKTPEELSLYETILLTKYKLRTSNLQNYQNQINQYFKKSYGLQYEILHRFDYDVDSLLNVSTYVTDENNQVTIPIENTSTSMKSLYILSMFQAYLDAPDRLSSIILIEEPEIHLHPELQKVTSEIIYKLSKKNQVIFTTHAPTMLFNFSKKQIRQVVLDNMYRTVIREHTNLDLILEDLGYTANDLMNVSFALIVEGKDDRSRIPLILNRFYNEIRDEEGLIKRIAIIPTNSCTNIKTYANLKFINQTYLRDNFLMIRDSDGKDPQMLIEQLCSFYFNRMRDDDAKIPRVTPRNVLILKYYSLENYFLNPEIMSKIGVIDTPEDFYDILYEKYELYLKNHKSVKNLLEQTHIKINCKDDIKKNIELIKIYVRGHNLFDIFYGKYKSRDEQNSILHKYVALASREDFADILDALDRFVYFDNRKENN